MVDNTYKEIGRHHNLLGVILISIYGIVQASNYILQTIGSSNNGLLTLVVLLYILTYKVLVYKKLTISKLAICSYLFLLICVLYRYFSISSAAWGNYYLIGASVCCVSLMQFIQDEFSESQKRTLGNTLIVTYLFDSIYNVLFFSAASYGLSESYSLKAQNSTALTLFSCVLLLLLFTNISRLRKVFYLVVLLVVSYLNIVIMARATNVILTIIGFILVFLFKGTDISKRKRQNIYFVLFSGLLIIFILLPNILTQIINHMDSASRLKPRLEGMLFYIRGQQYTSYLQGSFAERINLFLASIHTWLESLRNFIFGIGDHRYISLSLASAYSIGIGGHSDIADTLARYGLLGGSLFFGIYKYTIRNYMHYFQNTGVWMQVAVIIGVYILRSFMGVTFLPTICCVIYLMIPTVPALITQGNKKK